MVALRFSILTPTRNRCLMLQEAIASVHAQNWPNVEHIIADGGSSDDTLEMLAAAEGVQVLTGPDRGIYDGLNRALSVADGDVIGWLNSDDAYEAGAFAAAAMEFENNPEAAAVCGGVIFEREGTVERVYPSELVADLSPGAVLIGPTLPNAWFFRRRVVAELGPFATDLPFAADGDYLQRFTKLHASVTAVRQYFYRYRRHAGSATLSGKVVPDEVRRDMLRLALKWRGDPDPRVRAAARALEGRCRAALALSTLRGGRLDSALGHLSHVQTIAHGVFDYAAWRLLPNLRRRRLGMFPNAAAAG